MRELQEKQKMRKRLYSTPVLILLVFVTVLFIRGTYIVFTKKASSATYVKALSIKTDALHKKQTELEANIASLKTESGLEKEVKEKYNVAKEGEHVVILIDKTASSTGDMEEKLPWYKKFWNVIIGSL
jgi:cell division protein FtsB